MNKFKCPECHIISDEFIISKNDEEERLKCEEKYNDKIEEFKKIIETHNKNIIDEYEEEISIEYYLGFIPHEIKTKKLKHKNTWNLDTVRGVIDGRTVISTFIYKYAPLSYINYPINKEYITKKYDRYNYIKCKICGYKQYIK